MSDVRTFLVLLDYPDHVEFRVEGFPLLREGDVVDLEMDINDPTPKGAHNRMYGPRAKVWEVRGPYVVKKRIYRFTSMSPSKRGFSQYLEMEPKTEGPP